METKKLLKFGKFSFVVMAAILALALVQTTVAFAGGVGSTCGTIVDDGVDDGYGCYSIKDIFLNSSNFVKSDPLYYNETNAISIKNRENYADYSFGNHTQYNFSDSDGHYDINRLSLVCETRNLDGCNEHFLYFVYDTDTWDLDANGESFHVTGSVNVNGQKMWTINEWFEDKSDAHDYDWTAIWYISCEKFKDTVGCSMQEAIEKGIVDVQLDELECRSYNQGDDHWSRFDISHLTLGLGSSQSGDGKHYDFSDALGRTYDIYNLGLKAYSREDKGQEKLRFTYHTNTPAWDSSEDFKVSFIIFVDGSIYKCGTKEFTDRGDNDGKLDMTPIWECDTDKFVSEVGCTLVEGIANGRIVVMMKSLECDPC